MKKNTDTPQSYAEALRKRALAYPEAHEDHPWGEIAIKVRGKVFLFLGSSAEAVSFSLKLPQSAFSALLFEFTAPTGYGLGKSGWVSAKFPMELAPPLELIEEWIDESYRAVAPKALVKLLGGPDGVTNAGSPEARLQRKASAARSGASAVPSSKPAKRGSAARSSARPVQKKSPRRTPPK
ncbi:MAG: MmcQ/YjbR family DNA-binding protein [Candidatus Eisenbacteria bacterium]|nr:MmcQ/YjbR family DNA-binding protein [Candidatus Eisenbacteria bacterium]MCC7144558.1 MmcQ/YjbR family DNA-binding protein [Candidatus Eisenbacteria bacterium]